MEHSGAAFAILTMLAKNPLGFVLQILGDVIDAEDNVDPAVDPAPEMLGFRETFGP